MNPWHRVSSWGSLKDGDPDSPDAAFHAGRLKGVLRLNTAPWFAILVASDTSGVWLVNESGGIAIPLSWNWEHSHFNCVSPGYHSDQHVYAAGDTLYETDTTFAIPFLNWRHIPIQTASGNPLNPGQIYRVIVVQGPRKLVLASDGGVFWADIPPAGGNYSFKRATSLPGSRYSGLAEGAQNKVVVGAWGSDLDKHLGIFIGDWTGPSGDLIFQRAAITGSINVKQMLRTDIAACASDRSRLYAVCGGGSGLIPLPISPNNPDPQTDGFGDVVWQGDDLIYRVLISRDGGASWQVTGDAIKGTSDKLFGGPKDVIGHTQWGFNLCVGASPFDPDLVGVGVGGFAVSTSAGADWEVFTSSSSHHLHADIHGLYFDQTDPARTRLFICSDGGLASTPDLGKTFATGANRQLPNFQFNRFGASMQNSGLVGGSLQDNGNVYTMLYVNPDPWKDLDGGDGELMMFPQTRPPGKPGHLVRYNNTIALNVAGTPIEFGNRTRIAAWDDPKRTFQDLKLFPNDPLSRGVIPVDNTGDGLANPVVEVVDVPKWTNASGREMLAVAASGEKVFGLFEEDGGGPNRRFRWNQLAVVPHKPDKDPITGEERPYAATAAASFDGTAIFIGMNNGKVFRLDAPTWTATDLTIPGNSNSVIRFAVAAEGPQFAIAGERIYRYDGNSWTNVTPTTPAPTTQFKALTADRDSPQRQLFVASSSQLWTSASYGDAWSSMEGDLPRAPQIRDLRFVKESSGAEFLYLSTYGWSAFRSLLNADEFLNTMTVSGHMDIVDRVLVGNDVWAHPTISNVLQLGPLHPLEVVEYTEDCGEDVRVVLKLSFAWRMASLTVNIDYEATLIAKDEDNFVDDYETGSFTVSWGETKQQIIDLDSEELVPNEAHIEVNVAFP